MVSSLRTPAARLIAALGRAVSVVVPPLVLHAGATQALDAKSLPRQVKARSTAAVPLAHAHARHVRRPAARATAPAAAIATPAPAVARPQTIAIAAHPAQARPPSVALRRSSPPVVTPPAPSPSPPPASPPPPPAAPAPTGPPYVVAEESHGHGRSHAPGQLKKRQVAASPAAEPAQPPTSDNSDEWKAHGNSNENDHEHSNGNDHEHSNGNGHDGNNGRGKHG